MEALRQIKDRVARLEALLEQRLGARHGPLERRIRRAGRSLPRGVRHDLDRVAQASRMAGHPKLARRIDTARVTAAADRAEAHLRRVDARDRRKGALLGMLGALVFNLILLAALLLAVLRWRGYL